MKLKLIAATVAALTLAGTAAAAQVTTGVHVHVAKKHRVTVGLERHHGANLVGGSFLSAASTYLQLDKSAILADLAAGKSLAQIAATQGKTADGLVTALLAPAKLKLDAAVAAGKLSSDRATSLYSKLQTAVSSLVNKALPAPKTPPVHVGLTSVLQPVLSYLKLDLPTLFSQLRSGKTLAQIAVAQGGTAQGLTDAIVASVQTQLDKQVSAGHITAAQETAFLATLKTTVAKLVNG